MRMNNFIKLKFGILMKIVSLNYNHMPHFIVKTVAELIKTWFERWISDQNELSFISSLLFFILLWLLLVQLAILSLVINQFYCCIV